MARKSTAPPGKARASKAPRSARIAEGYTHPDQTVLMRPEIGTQANFRKKKPPVTYRFDSSLSPALEWDGKPGGREIGEWLVKVIEDAAKLDPPHVFTSPVEFRDAGGQILASVRSLAEAIDHLKRISAPFLNWAGKAERLSFDVPTLPLFVHERLSTKAIVETLVSHKSDKQVDLFDLFGDPRHSVTDQVLRAYEHADKWVNRLVLGDSLVVMNSLLHYERLGGQVQMIYIDPPYGVKFGSNFQPFVRKRDVSHGDDEDLTREPEMVKAYRDTWELGLHSYLTYMRDRLLLARELLTPSGSVFVQISDENLHHVRELMDEVMGGENFCGLIAFKTTSSQTDELIGAVCDYLLWYCKDRERVRYRRIYRPREAGSEGMYDWIELSNGQIEPLGDRDMSDLPSGARVFARDNLTSAKPPGSFPFPFGGRDYLPGRGFWKTHLAGLTRLGTESRIVGSGERVYYKRYFNDFPYVALNSFWSDTQSGGTFAGRDNKIYVVQTNSRVIQRCVLMTTDPGDLVLDPTCGSGTTAYVAEQWGRRWITVDTSRVPMALARQRLLTATFPYYELKDSAHGPSGGFVYRRKQNRKGEEVGGIVPHITLKSIANNEPPEEEVLVDRPEVDNSFVRVTGPFVVEATIPTPVDWEGDGVEDSGAETVESYGSFVERMIEVLRRSPVLHVDGGKKVEIANVRRPAKSLSISAEALVAATAEGQAPTVADAYDEAKEKNRGALPFSGKPVAFVFGPENGAISEKLVHEALKEAGLKGYTHLYVIGFAIQPHARQLVDHSAEMGLPPATYVQATPDLMMGDLLKNMRSSQIFSVCGLPEITVHKVAPEKKDDPQRWSIELVGLDTFDPTTMKTEHRGGNDVPCWLLDSDYNNLCFRATQVFFPRTGAWDSLRKALKADYDETVWDHLAGTRSAPFEAGEHKQVAVKVIDDRGNELLVVKELG
jgi:adenine-specific DNA-methyltransferase